MKRRRIIFWIEQRSDGLGLRHGIDQQPASVHQSLTRGVDVTWWTGGVVSLTLSELHEAYKCLCTWDIWKSTWVWKKDDKGTSMTWRFVCLRVCDRSRAWWLRCRVLTPRGAAATCRLINSVLFVARLVPTTPAAMIKRDALKGQEALQSTPDTSWTPSTHNQTSHLDQNRMLF